MGRQSANKGKVSSVLMIDDNVIELNVCESLLRSTFNCKVNSVKSVAGALEFLKKIRAGDEVPDVIICDLNLPYLDGYDFLKEYEGLPDHIKKSSRLYILSGSYDDNDLKYFANAKTVNRFLKKPLNTSELVA